MRKFANKAIILAGLMFMLSIVAKVAGGSFLGVRPPTFLAMASTILLFSANFLLFEILDKK
ncbi:MAG: hypothetical protein ABH875_05625 [Candidatus Omnitrophota bacterium]